MYDYRTANFKTPVMLGEELRDFGNQVIRFKKRFCIDVIEMFLDRDPIDHILAIYGLRRTGKTTLMRQVVLGMTADELDTAAYIRVNKKVTADDIYHDMKKLLQTGYKTVLIDEVTMMEDFIDSAGMLSDLFATCGMKIIISGTDSLGIWLASKQELYDRVYMLHTTFISYKEFCHVIGKVPISDYIRYGGTLAVGRDSYNRRYLDGDTSTFGNIASTKDYVTTAVSTNIQNSLVNCKYGSYLRHLQELFDADELTNAINRLVEHMSRKFIASVVNRKFKSSDLGSVSDILRKSKDPNRRSDLLLYIDKEGVTTRLMNFLSIRNPEDLKVVVTQTHIDEIKEYLHALDLVIDFPVESIPSSAEDTDDVSVIFTQPGMRFSIAMELVKALKADRSFGSAPDDEQSMICDVTFEDVEGRILEDIVVLETFLAVRKPKRVFKLLFKAGEFDMVIYDSGSHTCECYEIKRSSKIVESQCKHLLDADMCECTSRKYGKITKKCVLYRGESCVLDNGIEYVNVEEYLLNL